MLSTVTQWCQHCQISGAVKSLEVHSTRSCHVYFIGFFSPPSRPIQNTSVLPKGINTVQVSCSQCLSFNICVVLKHQKAQGCHCKQNVIVSQKKKKKKSHKIYLKINQIPTIVLMQHWLAIQKVQGLTQSFVK